MAVVVFDPQEWLGTHPRFEGLLTDAQLQNAFDVACLLLDNTEASPVPYDPPAGVMTRKTLLYMLVCHLATLALRPLEQVGVMTNATEGSVSVGFQLPTVTNGQWYQQSQCGQAYWQAIQKYLVGGRYYAAKQYHPWG